MKYFILQEDKKFIDPPKLSGWKQYINIQEIYEGNYSRLPDRFLCKVVNKEHNDWDTLFYPFFLMSKELMKTVSMFEPCLPSKEVILLDQKKSDVKEYYLPILRKIDCLTEESEFNRDHSEVTRGVIRREAVKDNTIFEIEGLKKQSIVIRLDLAECMLRRNLKGFNLKPIYVEGE